MGFLDVIHQLREGTSGLNCVLQEMVGSAANSLCDVRHQHCNRDHSFRLDATVEMVTLRKSVLWRLLDRRGKRVNRSKDLPSHRRKIHQGGALYHLRPCHPESHYNVRLCWNDSNQLRRRRKACTLKNWLV